MDDHDSGPLDYQSTHTKAAEGKPPSRIPVIVGCVHLLLFAVLVVFQQAVVLPDSVASILSPFFVLIVFVLPVLLAAEAVLMVVRPRASLGLLLLCHTVCVLYLIWIVLNAHW